MFSFTWRPRMSSILKPGLSDALAVAAASPNVRLLQHRRERLLRERVRCASGVDRLRDVVDAGQAQSLADGSNRRRRHRQLPVPETGKEERAFARGREFA